jgi:hypothetical protein
MELFREKKNNIYVRNSDLHKNKEEDHRRKK